MTEQPNLPEGQAGPPPLPRQGTSAAKVLGYASVITPALVMVIPLVIATNRSAFPTPGETGLALLGLACLGLLTAGVVCGIASIAMRRPQERVMGWAVTGIVVNVAVVAVLLVLGARTQEQKRVRAQNQASIAKARQEMQEQVEENLKNGDFKGDPSKVENLRKAMDQASKDSSGDEGRVLKASADYLAKLQIESVAFQKEMNAFLELGALEFAGVTEIKELAERRTKVRAYLAANQRMRSFILGAEKAFETELVRNKVNARDHERAMNEYRSAGRDINATVVEIRDSDTIIVETTLEMYDMLEQHWGKWKYDAKRERVVFQEPTINTSFAKLGQKIADTADEQVALQRKLAELQKKPKGAAKAARAADGKK